MATDDNAVLVVGAGPSGLMMALELASRGVAVRIVEKLDQRSPYSRALVVHARSLELFQNLGIDGEFLAAGFRTIGVSVHVRARRAAQVTFADIGLTGTPFPYVLFISQAETERILEQALTTRGVHVERSVTLARFQIDNAGVDAVLTHADGTTETVRCAYLVGCDGAHSAVRHGLGFKFEGAPYEQAFVLADARIDWSLPRDGLVLSLGSPGLVAGFPFPDGTHRLIVTAPGYMENADVPLAVEEVERLVRRVTGVDIRVTAPVWLSRFRLHHRIAERYSTGRAFLVGDAAHIHSPAGGQGMNTGIQDAANLAWKLALVLQRRADGTLLESYNTERRPIGETLLKRTDRLFEAAATANRWVVALRNLLIPRIAPIVMGFRPMRRRLFRFVSQLGIHYRWSAVVVDADGGRGLRAGDRAPDAFLGRAGGAISLFEAMRGADHRLLVFGAGSFNSEIVQALPFPCRVIEIERGASSLSDSSREARERYGVGAGGAVFLVRPDGYIGVRASFATLERALHRYVEALGVVR